MNQSGLLQDAQRAQQAGDLANARTLYRRFLDGHSDAHAQMLLAACEADLGDLGAAVGLLESARTAPVPPPGVEALYLKVLRAAARRAFDVGDLAPAVDLIRRAADAGDFRSLNREIGYLVCDAILTELAGLLLRELRAPDVAARVAGRGCSRWCCRAVTARCWIAARLATVFGLIVASCVR